MSRESDYIANMRFAAAARTPRPKERNDFAWVSPEPVRPVTDPKVAAERRALEASQTYQAGLEIAGHVMRFTGCPGYYSCRQETHQEHLAYGRQLLEELGLIPDPESRGVRSVNGYTKEPERL